MDFNFNFDIPEILELDKAHISIDDRVLRRKKKILKRIFSQVKMLDDLVGFPSKKEEIYFVTEKQFNGFSLIQSVVRDRHIDEIYISTYRMNDVAVQAMLSMIESNQIGRVVVVTSDFFTRKNGTEKFILDLMGFAEKNPEKIKLKIASCHAKVICIKSGDDYFVMEGSGNMTESAVLEQYHYLNDIELYNFHKFWMDEIKTKNKPQNELDNISKTIKGISCE